MEVSSSEIDLEFDHIELDKSMTKEKVREIMLEEIKTIKNLIAI